MLEPGLNSESKQNTEREHIIRKIDKKLNINCGLDIILSNLNVLILIIDNYVINAVM